MITVKKDVVFQALEICAGTPVLRKGESEPNARGLPSTGLFFAQMVPHALMSSRSGHTHECFIYAVGLTA